MFTFKRINQGLDHKSRYREL